jgi:hypothetical protein
MLASAPMLENGSPSHAEPSHKRAQETQRTRIATHDSSFAARDHGQLTTQDRGQLTTPYQPC